MTDTIDTSTEAVATLAKRLRNIGYSGEEPHGFNFEELGRTVDDAATLLDALAKERDRATLSTISEGYLDVLVPSLSGTRPVNEIEHRNERAERIAAEIVNLRRERNEARRMLADADGVIWSLVQTPEKAPASGMQFCKSVERSLERHRAREAGR